MLFMTRTLQKSEQHFLLAKKSYLILKKWAVATKETKSYLKHCSPAVLGSE